LAYGVIETPKTEEFADRLKYIHQELTKLIKEYQPDLVAIEDLFFYKNVKTAIKVGQARGVIILTAVLAQVPMVEFTPLQVKQAISSYGRADKKQVQQMVKTFLGLKNIPQPDDAADALAVAICAANSSRLKNLLCSNK
jgi:crossover junction endodeoxyribonuclease RuvC